jgi:urea carboxylase system permease
MSVVEQTHHDPDSADLQNLGYHQQLHRRLGSYASFAAGFSFVSILTTVFQLFAFGYSFGGPTFFWTWPLVFAGQFLVALVFAELAARYPIAGCVYQWSRRLSGGFTGWFAGWMMLIGQVVSISAAAIALQVVLPSVWNGFEIVGNSATNAIILGSILIVITSFVNAIGVRVMAIVNSIGVTAELIGVTILVILLATHTKRGPSVVLHAPHQAGYLGLFLASALMAAYVMYGFDSAGELSEETRRPRRTAPRAILRALAVSGIGGAALLITGLMAAPSLTDGKLATIGLPYVLTSTLGPNVGRALLVDVAVAICVCTLAVQTASTRLMFSMARDGALPGGGLLAHVNRRTGAPMWPAIITGVIAIGLLGVNVGQSQIFAAVTSVAVVIVYIAYLLVTVPALISRLRGTFPQTDGFSLGKAGGIAVNTLAVGYGIAMAINIGWPRGAVYDPAGGNVYLQWFSVLFTGLVIIVGCVAYVTRTKTPTAAAVIVPQES